MHGFAVAGVAAFLILRSDWRFDNFIIMPKCQGFA
jgi:hypothetical protein